MAGIDPEASSRIFISYRREDSSGHVLALLPALRRHFGSERIFKDTDNIPPGADFLKFIKQELESCSVLLAIIGREWLTVQDARLKKRRLDNPDDFLRVEVATALKNERIRVIPVLIERATMPGTGDLPSDLADLQYRNAIELSDTRWETDVQLLIQAIERAADDSVTKPRATRPGLADLEKRRAREIGAHLSAAREAFEAGDFERTLWACDKALLLDPQRADVLELMDRARKAIDEQKIKAWLDEARQVMSQGDIGKATDLIDQALAIDQAFEPALSLRNDILALRRDRERERERARNIQAAIERARASFDEEDFDSAVRHADDALSADSGEVDAQDIRSKALAALEERRRQRELKRRAQQVVSEARAKFASGEHQPALTALREFSPSHELVSGALQELQIELAAVEEKQRLAAEDARREERRRAEAERAAAERVAAERAAAQRAAEERAAAERAAEQRAAAERAAAEQKTREERERQRQDADRRRKEEEREEQMRRQAKEAEERRLKQEAESRRRQEDESRRQKIEAERARMEQERLEREAAAASRSQGDKDENVQFTVFRRSAIQPEQWYPLLVFAHLTEGRPGEPDPIQQIAVEVEKALGESKTKFRAVTEDSGYPVARRGELRFVPHMDGVTFNPPECRFLWTESVHRQDFRMCADRSMNGRVARGAVSVFNGNLLLAEVQLSIKVDREAKDSAQEETRARPYRRIFASYSHRDSAIVEEFESHAAATGDRYLRDVVSLRSGEVWDQRLLKMIQEADVFQLFWSWNALSSPLVREEWRHALALNRPHFIRPVYWEEPLPEQAGLPPAELRKLHFQRVYPVAVPPASPVTPVRPPAPAPRSIAPLLRYGSVAAVLVAAVGLYVTTMRGPAPGDSAPAPPVETQARSTTPGTDGGAATGGGSPVAGGGPTIPPVAGPNAETPNNTVSNQPIGGAVEPPPAKTAPPPTATAKPTPPAGVDRSTPPGGRRGSAPTPGGQGGAEPAPTKPVEVPYIPAPPPTVNPPIEVPKTDPTPIVTKPAPPPVTKEPEKAPIVGAKPPITEPAKPPVITRLEEEGRVKDALAQYERGHDNLDAGAVRSVFPGAPAGLEKTFSDYQFYRLELVIQSISLSTDATSATAVCTLSHFFQPKVGRSQQYVRKQQFSFQKRGNSWLIVQIR